MLQSQKSGHATYSPRSTLFGLNVIKIKEEDRGAGT